MCVGPIDFIIQRLLGEFRLESAKTINSILNIDLAGFVYLHDILGMLIVCIFVWKNLFFTFFQYLIKYLFLAANEKHKRLKRVVSCMCSLSFNHLSALLSVSGGKSCMFSIVFLDY
jgi:hypothetical protein